MELVMQLDTALPQVVVQVLVAEVDLIDSNEFGVEFGLQSPVLFQRSLIPGGGTVTVNQSLPQQAVPGFNFNNVLLPPGSNTVIGEKIVGFQGLGNLGVGRVSPTNNIGGFVFSAASDSFNLLIRALRVQSRIDVLSRPQVTALDGQTARVNIGQQFPILANVTTTATGVIQQSIDRPIIGIKLEVTPKIMPDGRVVMRVIPEVSSVVTPPIQLGNGLLSTAVNIQQIETTISAYDGETIALGGLITTKDTKVENKIPWLGDVPGLGALFRYRTQNKSKTELLIILTPHVVYSKADAERVLAEEARRMDWIVGDVLKVHGQSFLDAAAAHAGPVTTIIDGKTPMLEQGPAPRQLPNGMPPANGPTMPPANGANAPLPNAPLPNPPMPNLPLPNSPMPMPPAGAQLPAPSPGSAAMPLVVPDRGPVAVAPPPDLSLTSRVQVRNTRDIVPQSPTAPNGGWPNGAVPYSPNATAPAASVHYGAAPAPVPNYPIQQPATSYLPSREVTR
jgi:hypothetical protein